MSTLQFENSRLVARFLDDAEAVNADLWSGFQAHLADEDNTRTHLFEGRYENLYIDAGKIPAVTRVLEAAEAAARDILGLPADQALRSGFWFNWMEPGQRTLPHSHDDDDELLSAVYYVRVPENSGQLVILDSHMTTSVEPEEGMFVFFGPDVRHEVTENRSGKGRLSIGLNIGPAA